MATVTEQTQIAMEEPVFIRREFTNEIDPHTRHRIGPVASTAHDEAALRRAQQPD